MKLYNGDCLDVMKTIQDKSIDMILCDLPYGSTDNKWDSIIPFDKLWEQYKRIIKDNGVIVLFGSGVFTSLIMNSNIKYYKYKYVWLKKTSTMFVHAKNRPMSKHEDIMVFSKASMGHKSLLKERRMPYNPQGLIKIDKKIKRDNTNFGNTFGSRPSHTGEFTQEFTNYPNDVLDNFYEDLATKKIHPSQKPVALLEYLIKTYTLENETVLDNCMGSGSTGVACKNTNRNFIGIEKDEKYFNIAKERIATKELKQQELFEFSGGEVV